MTYLDWLAGIAIPDDRERESYQKLIFALFEKEFYAIIHNDENRVADGENLRLIFENEWGVSCENMGPCSVLEMLVALAIRCENDIMYDPDEGDRTAIWFWEMMDNLGLSELDDWHFSERKVNAIVKKLNDRTYDKDGFGGPFYIAGFDRDMRKIELWYQMNFWLTSRFLE